LPKICRLLHSPMLSSVDKSGSLEGHPAIKTAPIKR
jgi:hypothetical protein